MQYFGGRPTCNFVGSCWNHLKLGRTLTCTSLNLSALVVLCSFLVANRAFALLHILRALYFVTVVNIVHWCSITYSELIPAKLSVSLWGRRVGGATTLESKAEAVKAKAGEGLGCPKGVPSSL